MITMKIKKSISIRIPVSIVLLVLFSICISSCRKIIEVNAEPVNTIVKSKQPALKVYIENSGSMDGYMCDGSQLKDAIYDYVSDLNRYTATTELCYINSKIIPYEGNLTSYIKDLNPTSFKQAGGNIANTNLGDILASVLESINDTTVAIFVSDCILDLPSKDATDFLSNCKIRIKDEIINTQKRIPNLGIEVLKLSSDFNGRYFQANGTVEVLNDVKRPYYIWIFGDKTYLSQLNSDVPLSIFDKYEFGGVVSFSNETDIAFEIINRGLTGNVVTPMHGNYNITIRADFSATLQPNDIIIDKSNYNFNNSSIVIDGIYPITNKSDIYTHYVNFTIPKGVQIAQDCLTFVMPKLPLWVSETNDETGTDIKNNLSKTTGIKYLIEGIADAYKTENICTKMIFNVKRR